MNGARPGEALGRFLRAAVVLGGCLIGPVSAEGARSAAAQPAQQGGSAPETAALRRYAEAIAQIARYASFVRADAEPGALMADTLKAYLARADTSSDFLTPREYAQLKRARLPGHAGVGLEIERTRDGTVVCLPLADGPAARSGIQAGDRLVSIDKLHATGKPLTTLAAAATGKAGTTLDIEIERGGRRRALAIAREPLSARTVISGRYGALAVIRLLGFAPGTRQELAHLLSVRDAGRPLVLDLRGNAGGDLHAAIDTAALFLARGDPIVSVRSRAGIKPYTSTIAATAGLAAQRVLLWQDAGTASAAEVFIAALTENDRGLSIGARSFGKGTRQDIIELSDGSALVLTTGHLRTPRGTEFDGRGLDPGYPVAGRSTAAYVDKTRELANFGRVGRVSGG